MFWVQSNRIGLVEERIAGIRDQALIVAGALAEYAADPDHRAIETAQAEPLLRQLISPTHLRARVYSTAGRLQIDTRNLLARNLVTTEQLPAPEPTNRFTAFFNRSVTAVERRAVASATALPRERQPRDARGQRNESQLSHDGCGSIFFW